MHPHHGPIQVNKDVLPEIGDGNELLGETDITAAIAQMQPESSDDEEGDEDSEEPSSPKKKQRLSYVPALPLGCMT